jgi:hypothetical protein
VLVDETARAFAKTSINNPSMRNSLGLAKEGAFH